MKVSDIIVYIMKIVLGDFKKIRSSRFKDIQKNAKSPNLNEVVLRQVVRKRIKSLLKRLKNIGMASEKLYQDTLTATLFKVKSRSKNFCIFC